MHDLPLQMTPTANIFHTAASCLFQGVQHIFRTSLAADVACSKADIIISSPQTTKEPML